MDNTTYPIRGIRCKMCGGDLLITEGASTCTCEYCGTEQTIPAIQDEMIVESGHEVNITPRLKRAFLFLEDGDWRRADEFCEQVLNLDPENAQAYVGKLMIELKVQKQEDLVNCEMPFDDNGNYIKAVRFASPELKEELEGYVKSIKDRNETDRLNRLYAEAERKYRAAETGNALVQIASYKKAIELLESLNGWKDSDEKIAEYKSAIQELTEKEEAERRERAQKAEEERKARFEKAKEERLERERHDERMRQIEEAAKKKKQKLKIAACMIVLAAIVGLVFRKYVIIPNNQYKDAERLLSEGDYDGAIGIFTELGDYKDSPDRVYEAKKALYDEAGTLLYKNGEIVKAALTYGKLGDYSDAREMSLALWDWFACRNTIEAGLRHTVGLRSDGTVVAVGWNNDGQCDVSGWSDIAAVAAGDYHTVGLKTDGTVIAVGWNNDGQCDVSDWTDIVAVAAGSQDTIGLKSDGTVIAAGENNQGQCVVSDWTDIIAVAAGDYHTVGLKADGTVVAVGYNEDGRCDVSDWTDIIAVAAGYRNTIGLKSNGTVVAAGYDNYGRYDASGWTNIAAIAAGEDYTIGIRSDGTAIAIGENNYGQSYVFDWNDMVAVAAGDYHTVGLKTDGTVVAVGDNEKGQCDVSDWSDIRIPK